MIRRLVILAAIGLYGTFMHSAWHSAWSLEGRTFEQCYEAALARSETLAIQEELLVQQEENYRKAVGNVLPDIALTASRTWQEPATGGVGRDIFPSAQSLAKIGATQPLFRGLRELAAIRASKKLIVAQDETLRSAAFQLYVDVSQSFYTILSLEQDLRNIEAELDLYRRRVAELNERRAIGRSRLSEVLTTESVASALRAQGKQLQVQIGAARAVLAFLTGFDAATPLSGDASVQVADDPVAAYLSRIGKRPDVRAEEQKVLAADENIWVAKGAHLPTLDLNGNTYLARSGSLKDVTWDVQVALSFPIYAGGEIQSEVRQASSQLRQAEKSKERVSRLAQQEILALYEAVIGQQEQLKALEQALKLSEKNYAEQSKDYRLGLVTNLDVLQALTSFKENQRTLDRVRYDFRHNVLRLRVAAVQEPPEALLNAKLARPK